MFSVKYMQNLKLCFDELNASNSSEVRVVDVQTAAGGYTSTQYLTSLTHNVDEIL